MNTAYHPAYLIGVTGHMDLDQDQESTLEKRVELLFRFLKSTPQATTRVQRLEELVQALAPGNADAQKTYTAALQSWCGLPHTPVVVLSSLAPGADSLVARVALKPEFKQLGFSVQAPLSFPHDLYPAASTFVWKADDGTVDPESDANKQRQQQYADLVAAIGGESQTFPVCLDKDQKLVAEPGELAKKQHDQFLQDRDASDHAARHDRYRAAGEYIAAYSHLLIAIWDQDHDHQTDTGTAAIVETRRSCLTPHLLPTTNAVGLPHGGPLVHLTTRRLKNTSPPRETASPVAPIRFLHPHSTAPAPKTPEEQVTDDHLGWQENSLTLFCRIATNLDDFNRTTVSDEQEVDKELNARLTRLITGKKSDSLTCTLKEQSRDFHDGLRRVAGLRRSAADDTTHFHKTSLRTLTWLFRLTLLAAATLHLFAHWHPQHDHDDSPTTRQTTAHPIAVRTDAEPGRTHRENADEADAAVDASTPATTEAVKPVAETPREHEQQGSTTEEKPTLGCQYWIQPILGILSLCLAGCALLLFWWHKCRLDDEHDHDCRSLAEGLRVQFYWNLAGLGESVSANYMQRQRSELDWIRGAIRWSSFPYERWRLRFDALLPATQTAVIESVHESWVAHQSKFFRDRAHMRHHELHFWHKLGWTLAMTGLWTFLVLVLCKLPLSLVSSVEKTHWLPFALALVTTVVLAWWTSQHSRPGHHDGPQHADKQTRQTSWLKSRKDAVWKFMDDLLQRYVPTTDAHTSRAVTSGQKSREMLNNFSAYLLPSATMSAGVLTVSALLEWVSFLPDASNLAIVFGGWCLLSGAMSVAWGEKNLLSELAYQYSTMATLFRSAEIRLDVLLVQLRAQEADPAAYSQTMTEVRELLQSLGKEALDENAEWLILHRARPLEPVMAG
ncbi:MAG: hypothetical protein AABP62_20180 [Planctomycetota bacterium]